MAYGWLYVLNPFGQGASALLNYVKDVDVISGDTLPIYFDISSSKAPYVIVGFVGWYLNTIGYIVFRFYKIDVMSTRIYAVLFRRFLFVMGVALVLRAAGAKESLVLILLIAMSPLSAVAMLADFGSKRLRVGRSKRRCRSCRVCRRGLV